MKTIIKLVLGGLMITLASGEIVAGAIDTAVDLIAQHERFMPRPYVCEGKQITIGYGCTDPYWIRKDNITKTEAKAVLRKTVVKILNNLDSDIGTLQLNNKRRAALCSFVFNEGWGNWLESTLRKKIKARAKTEEIHAEFRRWHYANGGISYDGLIKRREAEIKLWGK